MAETIGAAEVEGVVIPITIEDAASPKINELAKQFVEVGRRMKAAGKGEKEIIQYLADLIAEISRVNPKLAELGKTLSGSFDQASKNIHSIFAPESAGLFAGIDGFLKMAGKAFVAFKAAAMPGRELRRFADECTNINFKLSTMAMTAGMSVRELSQLGNAYKAFGGSAADAVRGQRSYELAMEQRRRGQGTGGVYAEAWRRYGIQFNANEKYSDYQRRVIQWMQQQGTGRAAEARKLNLKQMLGLSDAEFRVMNKGLSAWDAEQQRNAKYAPVAEAATKSAEELTAATAHLANAWQNVKDKVFVALAPILKGAYGIATKIADALGSISAEGQVAIAAVLAIGSAVGSIYAFAKGVKYLKGCIDAAKGLAALGKAAGEIAGGAGKAAGEAVGGAAGGIAGGAGKAAGGAAGGVVGGVASGVAKSTGAVLGTAVGAVAGAGGAIAGAWFSAKSSTYLEILARTVTSWFRIWHAISFKGVFGDAKFLKREIELGYAGLDPQTIKAMGLDGEKARVLALGFAKLGEQEFKTRNSIVMGLKGRGEETDQGGDVHVEKIEISINGDNLDPKGVADAVHEKIIEEFSVLASQDNTRELR